MNNKELKKLNRRDLLEIILEQTSRIESLEEKIDSLNKELEIKKINIKESGSIAEASLKLSEIFNKADEAANIYMENVRILARKEEKEIIKSAKNEKKRIVSECMEKCKKKEEILDKKLKELESKEVKTNNIKKNKKDKNK